MLKRAADFCVPVLAIVLAFSLAACMRQASLKNVVNYPAAGASGGNLAEAQVKSAILNACRDKGWVARETSPGLITATIEKRGKHQAQVDIPYSSSSFSINYRSSSGLNYNASEQTIHNQYNNWVDYLRQAIDAQLARI